MKKKIEMENLIDKKKKMNDDLRKLQNELETIEDVKAKKDLESKRMLEKALKRMGDDNLAKNDFLTD